jgi:2,4-dienoyl-CoA reductase-like NADH-dependent reductase (Old Yellow Enzyme family)
MKKIVTNAYIFNDMRDCRRMFAEVVEDTRYETGHHIVTSRVIAVDTEKGYVQTESGTEYFVQKLLDKDEFIDYVKRTYDDERAEYYLAYANLK